MRKPFSPATSGERWGCSAQKIRQMYRRCELDGFRPDVVALRPYAASLLSEV